MFASLEKNVEEQEDVDGGQKVANQGYQAPGPGLSLQMQVLCRALCMTAIEKSVKIMQIHFTNHLTAECGDEEGCWMS